MNNNEQVKIAQCGCGKSHEFQDSTYGKGKRVFNSASSKGAKSRRFRCTVCAKEKEL